MLWNIHGFYTNLNGQVNLYLLVINNEYNDILLHNSRQKTDSNVVYVKAATATTQGSTLIFSMKIIRRERE